MLPGDVYVTVHGQSSIAPAPYSFLQLIEGPAVSSVTPLVGPVAGGAVVTLRGSNFNYNATVVFVDVSVNGTGVESECVWRGMADPELGCSDTTITCVAVAA